MGLELPVVIESDLGGYRIEIVNTKARHKAPQKRTIVSELVLLTLMAGAVASLCQLERLSVDAFSCDLPPFLVQFDSWQKHISASWLKIHTPQSHSLHPHKQKIPRFYSKVLFFVVAKDKDDKQNTCDHSL